MLNAGRDVQQSPMMAVLLRHANQTLWSVEPTKEGMDLKPFLMDLYGYARNFNLRELHEDIGVNRNTIWRIFKRGHDLHFSTLIRLLHFMRLRVRLEVDPVSRRVDFGRDDASRVNKSGKWEL